MAKYKLGIDVGGTFTDFLLIEEGGEATIHKTLSTPEDPSVGLVSGLKELAELRNQGFDSFIGEIETIVHGTTVATNALLTLKGAKTALVTTEGFRDALEMRRGIREEQYNNHYKNVSPLVPRYLRRAVRERIDGKGNVIEELRTADLAELVEVFKEEKIQAVAVCFMNAFKNSAHEREATEFLRARLPECFVTASSEVLPSIRFYERVSTTVVNAFVGPIVANYLDNLTAKLSKIDFKGKLLVMQSNGGVVTPDIVKRIPAVTVLSGPAAGPTAGLFYANRLGYRNCITVDMGGTSFDASIVVDGESVTGTDGSINRYRVALPSLDIVTIGAGGGSLGWINNGGLLQMGPESAGALPGPVCYGKGGRLPTCTDADLVLGYLSADFFAGGRLRLDKPRAEKAIHEEIASRLGLSTLDAAAGMYRVINSNMAQGVRQVSIERGYDPREFLFIVAGGAGPIHASEICRELGITMFLVPNVSSIFCAAGMLLGDLKHDYVSSYLGTFSALEKARFLGVYDEMRSRGIRTLREEGIGEENIELSPVMDVRYLGQYHEVRLQVPWEYVSGFNIHGIARLFHKEHNRLFGYSLEDEGTEIELINVRLRVTGKTEKPKVIQSSRDRGRSTGAGALENARKGRRMAYIPGLREMREIDVYDGDKIDVYDGDKIDVYDGDMWLAGRMIKGPAVIEKVTTSIFVGESDDCFVDELGSFIVYDRAAFPEGFHEGFWHGRR